MATLKERVAAGHKVAGVIHVVQVKAEAGLQAASVQVQTARDAAVAVPPVPPEPSAEGVNTPRPLPQTLARVGPSEPV